jgi:hypothetical protein
MKVYQILYTTVDRAQIIIQKNILIHIQNLLMSMMTTKSRLKLQGDEDYEYWDIKLLKDGYYLYYFKPIWVQNNIQGIQLLGY